MAMCCVCGWKPDKARENTDLREVVVCIPEEHIENIEPRRFRLLAKSGQAKRLTSWRTRAEPFCDKTRYLCEECTDKAARAWRQS
jgi:hypothetical protein